MMNTAIEPAVAGSKATMRAIVRDRYGEADALRLAEVERPELGDGEVLIRVSAAGLARSAWHLMTGLPYLVRIAGYGLRAPKNRVLGSELAGIVESVGGQVTRFRPGDAVFGSARSGAFAEYAVAREDALAPKPASLTFEEAAAVPESGVTAVQALRHAHVSAGDKILVIGASGGVGTYAVQIAKALGAWVTGVSSTEKVDLVRGLGADNVIDYTAGDFAEPGQTYDAILDIGGSRSLATLRRHLTATGRLVIVGGEGGGRLMGPVGRSLQGLVLSAFGRQKFVTFLAAVRSPDLQFLSGLIEAGKLKAAVDRTYPLSETAEAIRYLEAGRARGKLVIRVADVT